MSIKTEWVTPLFLSIVLALGILLWSGRFKPHTGTSTQYQSQRFEQVLQLIQDHYVDSVDLARFTDEAIRQALDALDPHTNYQPKQDAIWDRDRLQGHFEGIGVEFVLLQDTILLIYVVPDGPSAQAGLRPGDQIIAVDGESFVGPAMTNARVMQYLRGTQGTQVHVDIQRGPKVLRSVRITRNKVPLPAIDAAYMLDARSGYVHITQFGAQLIEDFTAAVERLKTQGMKRLVLDLRNNAGGFLRPAVQLTDLFLPVGDTIVSTQGLRRPTRLYKARSAAQYTLPLLVLINDNTASAAEIVTGALQDNARAWVVGRRSFGKGLVQEPMWLSDSAELRLTIARYYTPNGRCIQNPYRLLGAAPTDSAAGGIVPDQLVEVPPRSSPCLVNGKAQQLILRTAARHCATHAGNEPTPVPEQVIRQMYTTLCASDTPTPEDIQWLRQSVTQRMAYMYGGAQGMREASLSYDLLLQAALNNWDSAEARIPSN